jgi:FMN phosphatase YigB (HAD superfamily)
MISAVLFDLDGTLLRVDTAQLIDAYVRLLAAWFTPWVPPERFVPALLAATQTMMENRDPTRTNREVFDAAFYPALGLSAESMAAPLAEFYQREFPRLRTPAAADPAAREAVSVVLARDRLAVMATQPIFPEVAVRERMAWAGVADLPFALVTTYETSHFCKPHPEYFLEAAAHINHDPRDCLFVGNDAIEDAVAGEVGMQTYLITDYLTNRGRLKPRTVRIGPLQGLPGFLARVE